MQRLGALDSVFLNLEEPRLPMHIGALLTFETEAESPGRLPSSTARGGRPGRPGKR